MASDDDHEITYKAGMVAQWRLLDEKEESGDREDNMTPHRWKWSRFMWSRLLGWL